MEDEWVQCYHLTNQNVFEGSSIALSDLLLINAVPLWDSVEAEMVKEAKRAHTHTHAHVSTDADAQGGKAGKSPYSTTSLPVRILQQHTAETQSRSAPFSS